LISFFFLGSHATFSIWRSRSPGWGRLFRSDRISKKKNEPFLQIQSSQRGRSHQAEPICFDFLAVSSPWFHRYFQKKGNEARARSDRIPAPIAYQLARPQTLSVVAREAPSVGAGMGRSTPDAFCGPARDWPDSVRPKFEFVKKKQKKGDVYCTHTAPIYSKKKQEEPNYLVRFASPSRCRVFPASYISAATRFSTFSLPR
jgi:hypothetical protein